MHHHYKPFVGLWVFRANLAVNYFIVLSGFVTHFAYGSRELRSWPARRSYYLNRFARVALSYYFFLASHLLLVEALTDGLKNGYKWVDGRGFVSCSHCVHLWQLPNTWLAWLMVDAWTFTYSPANYGNWAMSTFAFFWIIYPWLSSVLTHASNRTLALVALSSGLPILTLLTWPCGVRFTPTYVDMREQIHVFPLVRLPEFIFGAVLAEAIPRLTPHATARVERFGGLIADASFVLVVWAAVFWVAPAGPVSVSSVDQRFWFYAGMTLPVGAFILGSSAPPPSRGGLVARVLAHPLLSVPGAVSFQVFLFQRPMGEVFDALYRWQHGGANAHHKFEGAFFVAFFVATWAFAWSFARWVETPVMARVRGKQRVVLL